MTQAKVHEDWRRSYRQQCVAREGEKSFQLVVAETDLRVVAEEDFAPAMLNLVHSLRADLKGWIALHPEFRTSLVPLPVPQEGQSPEIVRRMCLGAQQAGVGPFAAVAGVVAQMVAEAFVAKSSNIIVENGGDIYMFSRVSRVVGLLADPASGASLGLMLQPKDFPLSLCASSATIGHSLSLGCGELAVIRARDAALCDAAATALGNRLREAADVETALAFAASLEGAGVQGAFMQCGDKVGVWGQMELTAL